MCPASELADDIEPHDHIYSAVLTGAPLYGDQRHVGRGVPGVGLGGCLGGYTGTHPSSQPEARLRLIYRIYRLNRFIRPFDW